MKKIKTDISIVVLGEVNAGKSTTIGQLIYKHGTISKRTVEAYENKAKQLGKMQDYVWILNKLKVDRERGLVIDAAFWSLNTPNHNIYITEVPGHKDFIKNMITGSSQVQCAIIIIPASLEEFEFVTSAYGKTKEQILLSCALGIEQVIVLVNKMDCKEVSFSQARFEEIKNGIRNLFNKAAYKPPQITFLPISGLLGDNLFEKSPYMTWYQGPTVMEALNSLSPPQPLKDKPLRVPVQDVYKIGGIGTVPVGRVESGLLDRQMTVIFVPGNVVAEVKSVEKHFDDMAPAEPGTNAGFNVKNVPVKNLRRGMVCGDVKNNPPKECLWFVALVVLLNHPDKICNGYKPVMDIHTAHIACEFEQILAKIDRRSGRIVEDYPKFLRAGDCALVRIVPLKPVCVERFCDFEALGRFACRHNGSTAVGIIKHVTREGDSWRIVRLVWIGKLKNTQQCPLTWLPPELIRIIVAVVCTKHVR